MFPITAPSGAAKARATPDDPAYRPVAMTPGHLHTLRAAIQRVVPQPEEARIDLAARLDAQLGKQQGDGWRFAILPDDATAYARGLSVLDERARAEHGEGFADLAGDLQDSLLARAAAGRLHAQTPGLLDAAQMRRWFEELRADAVKIYVSHPATLAGLGYSGIAYAGDGDCKPGFRMVGLGERESWEPVARGASETPEDTQ